LPSLEDCQRAITAAKTKDTALASIEAILPVLAIPVKGPAASSEAARRQVLKERKH